MPVWNNDNKEEFRQVVGDLLNDPKVLALRDMAQHSKMCNRLEHSVYVSYISFLICRRLGLDYVAAARAGLLHDFHFGSEDDGVKRLWKHPHDALENAQQHYQLNDLEKDIIVKHMWPLTPRPPRHRESFVVSLADKFCASMEMVRLYRLFRVHKNLAPAAA